MYSREPRWRRAWLYLSVVGFALLAGMLAFAYMATVTSIMDANYPALARASLRQDASIALIAVPAAALSWWLVIVKPHHPSKIAGCFAGLLTIVFGVLGVIAPLPISHPPHTLAELGDDIVYTLEIWFFGVIALCAFPVGWGMWLLGGTAGALYGWFIQRRTLEASKQEISEEVAGDD